MALRLTLLTVLCAWSLISNAQQNAALINSGEIIEKGIKFHDDGKYKEALKEFDRIPVGDTNYVLAVYEAALSCSRDSQFTRGIAYCEKGLADKSDQVRHPEMLLLYGSLLDYNDKQERAIQIFDSAISVYPAYLNLYISKGTTLMRMNKYKEAEQALQQAALISPYSSNLHHKLALAAINQGKVVPAFLCMLASLTIEPGSRNYKDAINILSEISKSTDNVTELIRKRTEDPSSNFRLVEQIVLSKIALDKKYKIIIDLDDNISRQAQVMFEKLEFDESDPDFYMQYYVPLFKRIFENKKFEPFINYIFSAVDIKPIQDYNKKKKKDIEALKSDIVTYFNALRSTRELQFAKRNTNGALYHFEDGKLYGKGVIKEKDIFTGPWTFHYSLGNKKAEGVFNEKGEKEGAFSYYFFSGRIKAKENFRNGKQEGPQTYYYENGRVSSKGIYKNDEIDGEHTSYYENGEVKTIAHYTNGQLNGVKKTFYNAGPLQLEEHYVNGKRQGAAKTYYINGRPETEGNYANDELHGAFKAWNSDGVLTAEGSYTQGTLTGTVKRYYDNGQLQTVETYDNKGQLAEYASYHENGKPSYSFKNKNGKTTGDINYHDVDGKLFSTLTYVDDKLRAGRYFDKTGKQISASEAKGGKLEMTSYNADGTKNSVATYNENGVITGKKTYYYGSGKESVVEMYKDGSFHGETVGYHPGGKKSYAVNYTEGVKTGYYTSWFAHGGLSEEGWYGDDKLQGEWLSYNKFGKLSSRSWYLNGSRNGLKTEYWPTGQVHTVYQFEMDKFMSMVEYDTTGKLINIVKLEDGTGKFVSRYPNGKLYGECDYVNGDMEGLSIFYYPDGSKQTECFYKHGLLDSNYAAYSYGGKLRVQGKYKLGEKTGTWKYYTAQGVLYSTEEYKAGNPAKSRFYFKDGKLDTEFESRNNQRHGLYKRYAEDGSLMFQIRYENGTKMGYSYLDKTGKLVPEIPFIQGNGKLKAFYQNGNPSADMQYVDGVLHGDYKLYHPNGKVWITDTYVYDYSEGARTENFADGKPHLVHTYVHDNMHGPYKEYNAKGVLVEEGNYYVDSLHGEQRFYDDNGKLKQVRYYYYGLLLDVK